MSSPPTIDLPEGGQTPDTYNQTDQPSPAPEILAGTADEGIDINSEDHHRLVREVEERERHLRSAIAPTFDNMIRWWRLYLADIEDTREEGEEWRAAVHVPYPYSGVETRVASLVDILSSSDPPIQVGPVGDTEAEVARAVEELLTVTLDMNHWRFFLDTMLRDRCVQGTALYRVAFREEITNVNVTPLQNDMAHYEGQLAASIASALEAGLPPPPPPDQVGALMAWKMQATEAGIAFPPNPFAETVPTRTFYGPKYERVSIFDTRFDPTVDDLQHQPLFIVRSFVREKWLQDNTGPEPWKPFDPEAVEVGMRSMAPNDRSKHAKQDKEIQSVLSIPNSPGTLGVDPYYRKAHQLWECFMPGEEYPYCVILNEKVVINKKPRRMPYGHGLIPMVHMRNIPVGGYFCGISEIQQPERLYYEMNAHRNTLMDAVTLQTMPVFGKINAFGLPATQYQIKPGAVWDLPRKDSIDTITKSIPMQDSWNLFQSLKQDIDETNSTPPQLRGGPATVGRVSATESERRFSQALSRIKQDAIRVEEELVTMSKQDLYLWYQFTTVEQRAQMGMQNTISNEDILRGMDMNIRFRGPTRVINRDMQVQQMMTFVNTFQGLIPPDKAMVLARRIWEAMGLKNVDEIISPDDITRATAQASSPPTTQGGQPVGPEGPMPPTPMAPPIAPAPPAAALPEGYIPPVEAL